METKIIHEDKNVLDIEVTNLTVAEVLRTYLNKGGADVAAWRRDHPTKKPTLHIEASNPKKVLKAALEKLDKEIDQVMDDFKKLK